MTFPQHLIPIALLALGALSIHPAWAHGSAQSRHGGMTQMAHDLGFELVQGSDGITLYLMDHEQPLPSQGVSGKLTVLQGTQKTEVDLKPAGDNKLQAAGLKLAPGSKAVASLQIRGKAVTVRFTVK